SLNSGYVSASSRFSSELPGFPNMQVMPSASSWRRNAKRPVLVLVIPGLPTVPPQAVFEHVHQLLSGHGRIRRGASGDERIIDDHRRLLADIAVELTLGAGRVAQDVFQGVEGRPEVHERAVLVVQDLTGSGTHYAGVIAIIILDRMAGDVLAPDDALADAIIAGLGEAGHTVAFRRDGLVALDESHDQIVNAIIV